MTLFSRLFLPYHYFLPPPFSFTDVEVLWISPTLGPVVPTEPNTILVGVGNSTLGHILTVRPRIQISKRS